MAGIPLAQGLRAELLMEKQHAMLGHQRQQQSEL